MIATLTGKMIEKQPPYFVIDVAGVGYECLASDNAFAQMPEVGQEMQVFTHFVVREDAQLLFAFTDRNERFLFRHLLKVSGVGPKLAITILSSSDVNTLSQAILDQNVSVLTQIPGIGKKTAERLVIEMRDRLAKSWPVQAKLPGQNSSTATRANTTANQEAVEGLISLGYKPHTAIQMSKQVIADAKDPSLPAEAIIRAALQRISEYDRSG